MRKIKLLSIITCLLAGLNLSAQERIPLDKIAAIVGTHIIKASDIQNQFLQMEMENLPVDDRSKCQILEQILLQKLLLDQAGLDSIKLSDGQVNSELDKRIKALSEQIGTEQKLEAFYGKTIAEIKSDWRSLVEDQILANQMQNKIVTDIQVSPNEVRLFYKTLPKDSIPEVNPEYEMAQIVVKPPISIKQKLEVKQRMEELRQRVLKGESFSKLAVLYSEDLASAKKGGELGFVSRNDLVPDFAAVAFKLKEGEVSRIVETEYGYHIIQFIEKKGEKVNVRHILMSPKISKDNIIKGKAKIDSIYTLLKDTVPFAKIAGQLSDDESTKNNGGLYQNQYTGTSKFDPKQIDPSLFSVLKDLKTNGYSQPFLTQDETGKQVYKIVKLLSKTDAHKANILDDYQLIKAMALNDKKNKTLNDWVTAKLAKTYITIDASYHSCKFEHKGWIK
jgi:peptidyl-prolyl cis-trans isomerase SurA